MVDDLRQMFRRCARGLLLFLWVLPLAAAPSSHPVSQTQADPPPALQAAIAQALSANQTSRAADLLQQALQRYPEWREGWWQVGTMSYEQSDYLGGRMAFSRLAKLDPKAGATWVMLGLCDFELRDFGLSLLHIQKGRALGFPKNAQLSDVARYHQALDLILLEEYEQAGYILDSFAREDHPSDDILVAEGLSALHIPAIGPLYRNSVDAGFLQVVREAGKAQYAAAQKHPEAARKIYQELLRQHPDVPGLHYAYGALITRWGELQPGIEQFEAELKLSPNNAPARLQMAFSYYKLGKFSLALEQAEAAVRISASSFPAHYVLGLIDIAQRHLEQAARQLETSRDLQPDSSQVRYTLAQVYLRLHRPADARREELAFRRLQPIEASMLQHGTLPASVFEADQLPKPAQPSN